MAHWLLRLAKNCLTLSQEQMQVFKASLDLISSSDIAIKFAPLILYNYLCNKLTTD